MNKYVIRILYDLKGWAYYNRAIALQKFAPPDFEVSIGGDYGKAIAAKKHDLIFQLAFSYVEKLKRAMRGSRNCDTAVLLSSYNVGWGHANHWLDGTLKHSDHVIINNYDMWDKAGRRPNTTPLSNGVDNTIFYPTIAMKDRPKTVLWVGSNHHRKVKGFDDYVLPLTEMLKKDGIILDHRLTDSSRPSMNPQQMNEWYNSGSIYLVTSKCEGTPNPALEAASAGCVLVSTKVGNMPELIKNHVNGYLCERDLGALYLAIKNGITNRERISERILIDIKDWHWENRSKLFFDLFRKLIEERRKLPPRNRQTFAEKKKTALARPVVPARPRPGVPARPVRTVRERNKR